MKRLLLTTSVLALGLAGTAFAQTGAGSAAGAGAMGSNTGSPSYSSPSSGSSGSTTTRGSSGSTMNRQHMNGSGATAGPMASGTSGSRSSSGSMSGSSSMNSSRAGSGSANNVRQAQEALQDQGLYKGQVDGKMGPQTKRAIAQFQKQKGLKQTAQLDQQTLSDLENGSMSGSDNSSAAPTGRSPNSAPSFNSGGASSSGMSGTTGNTRGNGPASTQTNPGGMNSPTVPAH